MRTRKPMLILAGIFGVALAQAQSDAPAMKLLYRLADQAVLESTDTYWDYAKVEPGGNRLFIARAADGLTVFDIDRNTMVATVENSVGANGPLLLPEYNRGYVAMNDGSLLSFELDSLMALNRLALATDGGLNSGMLDPATGQVHFITGSRPEVSTWFTLDARNGELIKETEFPFRKMDDPATDGRGNLFAPVRYNDIVLHLDSKTLQEESRWEIGCHVSKLRYQQKTDRLLGACYGDHPDFFALDPATGKVTARIPIGRGQDGIAIDDLHHRIVTSNGTDANLTVIQQNGPDDYELLGSVATRPGARMMDIDHRTGDLYVVTADYSIVADTEGDGKKVYHPDSFTVLTYSPQ